uniref:DUF2452 domain-containing protein n=1 Tax=uncultured Thiotrichaceae bacterium TaxID=298394 RepID=A0A6S6SYT7_9GAMM|nr:MAG: Unknown protein [uncultured Thiotrichaceae bacterium]
MISDNQAVIKTPNPQGKGLVPVLAALSAAAYRSTAVPKQVEQIASELFTSMFVLESSFGFKPVPGRSYWLYRESGHYKLSLLSPEQWSAAVFGEVIGQCVLQNDLTWTLELSSEALGDIEFMDYIAERRRLFGEELQGAETVGDLLPVFQQKLPFYQRVFASAMAGSLGRSMQLSGIKGLSYEEARGLLTSDVDES